MTYRKDNPESIRAMFNSIAHDYDRTNAILSLQMHKKWNAALVKMIAEAKPKTLLDLCCGTGAIAFEYLVKSTEPVKAFMLDFSEEMLAQAKVQAQHLKLDKHEITYLHADAQAIPVGSNSIDCVSIAYGIRNVKKPSKCLDEVYRVLKSGGSFGILELTLPTNPLVRFGHKFYLKAILPLLGKLMTSNKEAYRYLSKSIPDFILPDQLQKMMMQSGFKDIKISSRFGGVATLISGRKP